MDPLSLGPPKVFGSHVCADVIKEWTTGGDLIPINLVQNFCLPANWTEDSKRHPVALTELYAVCCARFLWKDVLDGRRCLIFIDNQSVVDSLIKGGSSDHHLKRILCCYEQIDFNNPCLAWFTRVASSSNISDLPSRGEWGTLRKIIEFELVEAVCPFSGKRLRTIAEEKWGKDYK